MTMNVDEETDFPALSERQRKCMVCASERAKYTCPRCQTTTCCLACVKQHKSQSGCSGIRDKTAFVAVKDFSENYLLSDYRFLEDADRKRYSAVGDIKNKPGFLNFRWKLVSKEAYKRHIRLRLLPHHFTKHRENSTSFNKKTKLMMWHVKWLFPQAEAEYIDIRLQETVLLKEALCKYIHPEIADPVIRQRLKRYCSCGVDNVQVFMKVENQPANVLRYHRLSLNRTLKDNLVEKCLVEYPTMHVVLPENAVQYPLLTAGISVAGCGQDLSQTVEEKVEGEGEVEGKKKKKEVEEGEHTQTTQLAVSHDIPHVT